MIFIEDKDIASQYTDYYNKIWDSFNTVITKEEAKQYGDIILEVEYDPFVNP